MVFPYDMAVVREMKGAMKRTVVNKDDIDALVRFDKAYVSVSMPLHLFRNSVERIIELLAEPIQHGSRVLVDASACPYPSTEAIEVLLRIVKLYRVKTSVYTLPIANANDSWKKVFRIVNISELFVFCDSLEAAKNVYRG
ncbi:MAG: hypothetical protein AABZ39_09730 [Spirochaetota bacterium]